MVTDSEVRDAVDGGAETIEEVAACCGAGTGCGGCHDQIAEIIGERSAIAATPADAAAPASGSDCPRRRISVTSPLLRQSREATS